MPYKVSKRGSNWAIVKKLPGGRTKTVGHSKTKAKAQASIRVREENEPRKRRRRR
jgi:hypothetical protein